MVHQLPQLKFEYNALEPYIDEATMTIHHTKHHQGYVNNLNKALENFADLQKQSVEQLLSNLNELPSEIRTTVQNNGGGHYNHTLFWNSLTPSQTEMPNELRVALEDQFNSIDEFKNQFTTAATTRFGSGWAWLAKKGEDLTIMSTANQDNPISLGMTPLLGLDVWEHAYYLKYQNKRADYILNWWKVVDWSVVTELLMR